jgi:hypothetical protein
VTPDSTNPAGSGLIGLGPNAGSQIHATLGASSGDTVLDRIFKQNTSTPNFLTVLMGRYNDPTDIFSGDLTVGSIVPGYENVNNQPKMVVTEGPWCHALAIWRFLFSFQYQPFSLAISTGKLC